ncbi:MAG: hypothetical protein WKF37_13080 [Bryobacteraceae bacterium]
MSKPVEVTRRDLESALLLAAPALAQAPAADPANDLETARTQIRSNTGQFRTYAVPMATEPSFAFKP